MRCVACGTDNAEHRRFCRECGASMAGRCTACGAPREAEEKFCGQCGQPLATAPAQTAAPVVETVVAPPLAERRVCSVLFCDLVGFTPLSEARDPEEVRELLSRYFEVARTVIGRYGGVVEKFIGDAVMAVWGAPVAAEGDVERTVRAALDLVDAVAELGREVSAPGLAARAGVVTGEVAVTLGAVGQGMVAGDPVNTAARVQTAAAAGTVLVDEGTWRAARGAVAFASAGEHALKGKAEPVALWRAERVVSGVGGAQRVDGLEAPLVGRDAEMRLIKELFHASVERRSARLVSITGPAGVGKSRLGWEFEKYVDGLASIVRWHRGRCLSYGDGVAFWALAEMVRQRLGIAEEDPTAIAAQKLTVGLDRWLRDPAVREYVRPSLARLLGVDTGDHDGEPLTREELMAGWRLFFEQLAADAPVVLLVDDLHHADAGFLGFLDHLLDWTRDAPIFVLTLARPELDDRRPGWGTGRRNGTVLALEPLDNAATGALLDGLVPGMPEAAKEALAAQAQGIPMYAVETVRMLIDRDAVQPIDGVYRLVGDLGELAVPDSLQSLLAARLDALPPDARRLVSDAAVLGGRFPPEALVAVSGQPPEQVRRLLADLVRREVLAVSADPLSPERGQYGFVQTLVRQVAYDTLSRRERKARHVAVAEHLTRVYPEGGDEVSEVVSQHLLDAINAVPDDPDVPELRREAVASLVRAGDRAVRTGAPATAAHTFGAAAGLLEQVGAPDDDRLAAGLCERAGEAARMSGDFALSSRHYARAEELFSRIGLPRDAARARCGVARAVRRQGRYDEARRLLAEALSLLEDEPDADTVAAMLELATLEALSGGKDADRVIQLAFDHAQSLDLPEAVIAELFVIRGIAEATRGRHAQASASLREGVRRAELSGNVHLTARSLLNLSDVLVVSDPVAAADAAGRAVAAARRFGDLDMLPIAVTNLVTAQLVTGNWDAADATFAAAVDDGLGDDPYVAAYQVVVEVLHGKPVPAAALAAVEVLAGSEDPQDLSSVAVARGLASLSAGDWPAALAHAEDAIAHGATLGVGAEAVRWMWPIGADAALSLGDLDAVQRLLDWLDGYPAGHVPRLLRAERRRVWARLLAARGDDAGAEFDAAVRALRELGSPYHLAGGLLDHADYLAAGGDPTTAAAAAAEARAIAVRLRAEPMVGRADALLGSASPAPRSRPATGPVSAATR